MEKETSLIIRISPELKNDLSKIAIDKKTSNSEIIRSLITDYIDTYNGNKDRYFKALSKITNKVSGFGIMKSIDEYKEQWNLNKVDCYEIGKDEFELLTRLKELPNNEDYFELD